jgi:hypothetical protein
MTLYKRTDLNEGDLVLYVGNHVTKANEPPKYGFVPVENSHIMQEAGNMLKVLEGLETWYQNCNNLPTDIDLIGAYQRSQLILRRVREHNG